MASLFKVALPLAELREERHGLARERRSHHDEHERPQELRPCLAGCEKARGPGREAAQDQVEVLRPPEIEDVGAHGDRLGLHPAGTFAEHEPGHLAVAVLEIAEVLGAGRAGRYARGLLSALDARPAEVALVNFLRAWFDVPGLVGAGVDAKTAADAEIAVDADDAAGVLIRRARGARLDAGRAIALVALTHVGAGH